MLFTRNWNCKSQSHHLDKRSPSKTLAWVGIIVLSIENQERLIGLWADRQQENVSSKSTMHVKHACKTFRAMENVKQGSIIFIIEKVKTICVKNAKKNNKGEKR